MTAISTCPMSLWFPRPINSASAIPDWSNGTEPWQFGYDFSWSPRAYQTYLYTDRPVYRSGQPVYFRGIVRSKDDVVYMPAPQETAPVTIRDAQGEIVYQRDLAVSEFGTFNDSFEIAQDASLGVYILSLSLPTEDEFVQEGGGITFLVAEYRSAGVSGVLVDRAA